MHKHIIHSFHCRQSSQAGFSDIDVPYAKVRSLCLSYYCYLIDSFYLILKKKEHKTLEGKEAAFRLEQKKKQGCVVAYGDCIQVYNNIMTKHVLTIIVY